MIQVTGELVYRDAELVLHPDHSGNETNEKYLTFKEIVIFIHLFCISSILMEVYHPVSVFNK
jgi:hypothetical protein